jgi:F420-dependent NADP oxidoreductase-like protein
MQAADTKSVGIIGAGRIGTVMAQIARRAGRRVVISNSRGPQTLGTLVAQLGGDLGDRRVGGEPCRPAPVRRAERTEGHERDLALRAIGEQVVVSAVDDAVGVLDPGDVDELARMLERRAIDVGETDQLDFALAAEIVQRAELVRERHRRTVAGAGQAQVDEVEPLDAQGPQVRLDPSRSSEGAWARRTPPAPSRRQPTFVASLRPSGYGCSASRIRSLTTSGP